MSAFGCAHCVHILYCIALVVADFEAMDLRTFVETVQLQSLRLRLSQALLLPFHQVDMARDELFIDGVLEILAANDITEIRHFKGVDKLKYPDGTTGGKRASV